MSIKYKEVLFASDREARWAVFFEILGCRWDYHLQSFKVGKHARSPSFQVCAGKYVYWFDVTSVFPNQSQLAFGRAVAKHTNQQFCIFYQPFVRPSDEITDHIHLVSGCYVPLGVRLYPNGSHSRVSPQVFNQANPKRLLTALKAARDKVFK